MNGFKACGLVPFNPEAVQYNIFNKKKRKKRDETDDAEEIIATACATQGNQTYLQIFEREVLNPVILEEFKRDESSNIWTGDTSLQVLFDCLIKLINMPGKYTNNFSCVQFVVAYSYIFFSYLRQC